jgi:hypothetical protein
VILEKVLSKYFGFPCQLSFHRLLHTHHHLSSRAGTIGQLVTYVPSGLSLTPRQGKRHVREKHCLHLQDRRISPAWKSGLHSCLYYSSTLRDNTSPPKMLMDFYQTAGYHFPEVWSLHSHRCENLKSNISIHVFCVKTHALHRMTSLSITHEVTSEEWCCFHYTSFTLILT